MEMRKIGPPALGEAVTDRLLDLLSTSDDFRALFVRNPIEAIDLAGYEHGDSDMAHPGFCFQVTNLAAKEAIARDRAKLARAFNSIQSFLAPELLGLRDWLHQSVLRWLETPAISDAARLPCLP